MRPKITKALILLASLAALALGGSAIVQASGDNSGPSTAASVSVQDTGQANDQAGPNDGADAKDSGQADSEGNDSSDADQVQSGDQNGPDNNASQDNSGENTAGDGESGSEVPNNDGPGGHADEPGNPNANHQFQGAE